MLFWVKHFTRKWFEKKFSDAVANFGRFPKPAFVESRYFSFQVILIFFFLVGYKCVEFPLWQFFWGGQFRLILTIMPVFWLYLTPVRYLLLCSPKSTQWEFDTFMHYIFFECRFRLFFPCWHLSQLYSWSLVCYFTLGCCTKQQISAMPEMLSGHRTRDRD